VAFWAGRVRPVVSMLVVMMNPFMILPASVLQHLLVFAVACTCDACHVNEARHFQHWNSLPFK